MGCMRSREEAAAPAAARAQGTLGGQYAISGLLRLAWRSRDKTARGGV